MGRTVQLFVTGVVTIGIATAVLLPGRPTVGVIQATGQATKGVLGTAITGK